MELSVLNIEGKATGKKITLPESVFAIEPNEHAVYLDVKQHLANKRQGTHKAKERGEVRGSTRKIRKQKGSGGARFGSVRSPLLKGGGTVFGPRPHAYAFKLNKKVKELARKSVLTDQAKNANVSVLEDFNFATAKTKSFTSLLKNLDLTNKKVLLVLAEPNKNIYLSSRNLEGVKVLSVGELNTYDILNTNKVVFVESSVKELENTLS
ncbi:MAG: 50S ribosomal protein L4 [Bacteroidetes bacterium]|nr:50S ribosomal protein L4 [Bacteroidota bacterium]